MFKTNTRILILSALCVGFMTPAIFGQKDPRSNDEKKAGLAETSSSAAATKKAEKDKEKKNAFNTRSIRKYEPSVAQIDKKAKVLTLENEGSEPQQAQEDSTALAKKLANPVASLISVPFQNNFDFGMGPNGDGFRYTLNFQPVIPITLNKDWNLISRTIMPIIGQSDVVTHGTKQFGLGDTTQALFFSPNKTEPVIWAIGPQLLIPTATNQYLGTKKLSLGPTFLILKQTGPWTVGALTGHFWSVAGSSSRPPFSMTNLQPFVAYTTKTAWTYTFNTESTYDWKGNQWNVPVHFIVAKLVRFGKQPVSIGGALRCWAVTSPTGPSGCGFRLIVTPLFPKKG